MLKETPRPHLSYSQISCLDYSEKKYIQNYIYGKREQENDFLKLGKEIHKSLEKRDNKFPDIQKQIPEYKKREFEIKAKLDEIPLYGIIDGLSERPLKMCDYKTGLKPNVKGWTNQAIFYNLMLWLNKKKIAKENKIFFIKTKWNDDGQLVPINSVQEYLMNIELKDVIAYAPKVIDSWKRIKRLVEQERQMFGSLPFDK